MEKSKNKTRLTVVETPDLACKPGRDPDTINLLIDLLELAQQGELYGLAYVGLMKKNTVAHGMTAQVATRGITVKNYLSQLSKRLDVAS